MPDPQTSKKLSERDADQTLQGSFNDVDKTLSINGFLVGKVGHKITRIDTSAGNLNGATAGDDYSFYDSGLLLYTYRLLYSDASKEVFISAERVA